MKDSAVTCSLAKGFGDFFRSSCPARGCESIRMTFREDGPVERGKRPTRDRMSELREPEEPFGKKAA